MTATESPAQQLTIEVRNPADGRVVGEVPVDTAESVAAKVRELRLFQPEWEALGPRGRKEWLLKFGDWILDNAAHITDVLQSETGKTRADASIEAPGAVDMIGYWARNAEKFLGDTRAKPHSPLSADQEADRRLPAASGGRRHHPVEFPVRVAAMDVPRRWPPAPRCCSNPPRSRR